MKKGDKLVFKKFKWVLVDVVTNMFGVTYGKYSLRRKYFNAVYLKYSKSTYIIFPWQWEFYKRRLKEDPNFHYTKGRGAWMGGSD